MPDHEFISTSINTKQYARHLISLEHVFSENSEEEISFLVANQSLKPEESIISHLILSDDLDLENSPLGRTDKFTYVHDAGEILSIHSLPNVNDKFISVYRSFDSTRTIHATVWSLSSSKNSHEAELSLKPITQIPHESYSDIHAFAVAPHETISKCAMLCSSSANPNSVKTSSLSNSQYHVIIAESNSSSNDYLITQETPVTLANLEFTRTNFGPLNNGTTAMAWSPHHGCTNIGIALDSNVLGWDTRSAQPSFWLPCEAFVRCLDFSPNSEFAVVTGSDAGFVSLWDLRYAVNKVCGHSINENKHDFNAPTSNLAQWLQKFDEPSLSYRSYTHNHWVWSVKFHPTRDELVLSCGGDNRVCLHNFIIPDSSEQTDKQSPQISPLKEGVIVTSENHHTDSVYACAWSSVDSWTFATVSYDGNVFISTVPEQIKLAVLLQDDASLINDSEDDRIAEQDASDEVPD